MQLSLLRHADAVENAVSEAARELTAKGVEQARRVGTFGRQHGLVPELILSSPYRRAEQTARIFAEETGGGKVTVAKWLASGMNSKTARAELNGSLTLFTRENMRPGAAMLEFTLPPELL